MLPYKVAVIIGYSILIPAIIGLIRFRKIIPAYQPFIYYCLLDAVNHTLSIILIYRVHSNTVNSNIGVFIEALLFLLLFRNWGAFRKKNRVFTFLIILLTSVWVTDNLIWHQLITVNSFFRIVYSFMLIFLSIDQLNKLITSARRNLLLNSCFLICCGIVIYYSYKATIEVFFLIRLKASDTFYSDIFIILIFANLFVNLIFAWATLWIPKKQRFTLLP